MRQKEYIKKINYRDEHFAYIAKNCHHLSQEQMLSLLSKKRIESYMKQGLIKKIHYIYHSRQATAYELTEKGRTWIKKQFPELSGNCYTSRTAVRHNICLAEQIMKHCEEYGYSQERAWLNERDLRQELLERIERTTGEERFRLLGALERGELSVPDGAYYENGQLICIEIYNSNYTAEQILAKETCAEALGGTLRLVRQ